MVGKDDGEELVGWRDQPRFALVGDEDQEVWANCLDADGLFAQPDESPEWRTITLIECSVAGPLLRFCRRADDVEKELGNADLRLIDTEGNTIGSYFLGGVTAIRCRPKGAKPMTCDVTVEAFIIAPPHPAARPVWELWRTGQPRTKNEWAKPGENSQAWLHVLRVHSQWSGRRSVDATAGQTFELDGMHITDEASFFCAIGEAVNGPGGYFGAGLDGLSDCLCGGFGAKVPFTLIWKNSSVARAHLGKSPESPDREPCPPFFAEVLTIFDESSVQVILQ